MQEWCTVFFLTLHTAKLVCIFLVGVNTFAMSRLDSFMLYHRIQCRFSLIDA